MTCGSARLPGRIADGAVHGLGASDMKGGVAVMLELARAEVPARYVFFTREEVALEESPLPGVFESGVLGDTELAVVLEPTDAILHAGCLGNLLARVEFHGESAHSARPWTGRNAINSPSACWSGSGSKHGTWDGGWGTSSAGRNRAACSRTTYTRRARSSMHMRPPVTRRGARARSA